MGPQGEAALALSIYIASVYSAFSEACSGTTHFKARAIVLRAVALVMAANFVSVAVQCRGLIGPRGVLPLQQTLKDIADNLAYRDRKGLATPVTSRSMVRLTLGAWRAVGEHNVVAAAWGGCALALCVAAAPLQGPLSSCGWVLLYLGWYSYKRGLGIFANLQWDSLLLECAALCWLLSLPLASPAVTAVVHLVRSVVLRLHCGAGVAKLTSGDVHWRKLTAMAYHHQTQPLPTHLAPWLHALPLPLHKASTLAALALELATVVGCLTALLPFAGEAALAMVLAVQLAIASSGNFGYFNLLSAALGASLLDDSSPLLGLLLPRTAEPAHACLASVVALIAAVLLSLLYLLRFAAYAERLDGPLAFGRPYLRTAEMTFHVASRFSLFSNMATVRREVVLECSHDGVAWHELDFRYKPGAAARLKWVPPLHMPRLDWRLWLLAQGRPVAPWFDQLLHRLCDGVPEVHALLAPPPPQLATGPCPCRYVRARRYVYSFGPRGWARGEPECFGGTAEGGEAARRSD